MYVRFEYTPYKEIYIPGVLSGLNPTSRYINKTYLMSTLPIISDNGNNALEGYKGIKKYSYIASNQEFNEWSNTLRQKIDEIFNSFSTSICPEENIKQQSKTQNKDELNAYMNEVKSLPKSECNDSVFEEREKRNTVIEVFLSSGYNPETLITPVIKNYCESIKKCLFNSPYIYEYQSGFEEFRRKRKLEEADNIKYMKDPKFNNLDIIDYNIPDTLSSVISFYDEWESTNFELEDEIENFVL